MTTRKTTNRRSRAGEEAPPGGARPFTCSIHGAGVDVDVRVESLEPLRALSSAIGEAVDQAMRARAGGADPCVDLGSFTSTRRAGRPVGPRVDLIAIASDVLSGECAPDDVELDRLIDVLCGERTRRQEMRS